MFKKFIYVCTSTLIAVLLVAVTSNIKKDLAITKKELVAENVTADFSDVATKYFDYIQINKNYTLSFNSKAIFANRNVIDTEELDQLIAYEKFLAVLLKR